MSGYDPKLSHRLAIEAWLPTFYIPTQPDGGRPPPPKLALAPTDTLVATDDTPMIDAINTHILNSTYTWIYFIEGYPSEIKCYNMKRGSNAVLYF